MAFALGLLAALLGPAAPGRSSPGKAAAALERLDNWYELRGWEAVGLLELGSSRRCSGVLIAPDLVLTAAHCLYDPQTRAYVEPSRIRFLAAWRDGHAAAGRRGLRALVHPQFMAGPSGVGAIPYDLGVLKLDAAIPAVAAEPFTRLGGALRRGARVSVISYAAGRMGAPSRQDGCKVLDAAGGIVAMDCQVDHGASGAPVFELRDGRPRIVSVISSMVVGKGKRTAMGVLLGPELARVLRDFRAGRGVYPKKAPGARRIGIGSGHTAGGARFLRP